MKKILFYCDTVFGVGGVQRVLAEVAKRLSEEYEVTILTTDDIRQTRRYDYHRSSVRFVSLIYAPVSIWRRCDRSAVVLCVNIYFRRMNGLVLCMHGVSSYCLIRTN